MAAAVEKSEMSGNAAAKMKISPVTRVSPYMKRNLTQRPAHRTVPNTLPGPTSRTSKAKTPFKSSCASAPAFTTRSPAERLAASNSPLKAKRGASSVSAGVTRESHSVTVTQPEPQLERPSPYMLVPVRLKKTGPGTESNAPCLLAGSSSSFRLKLLDPEKVKSLALAARSPAPAGGTRLNLIPHETKTNKQPPVSRRQPVVPRSPVTQAASSRKRTGILGRREDETQRVRQKITTTGGDTESHLLTQQMDGLVLGDKDRVESTTCGNCQESNNPPGAPLQIVTIQNNISQFDETAQVDGRSLQEVNKHDQQKTSQCLPTIHSTSAENIGTGGDLGNGNLAKVDSDPRYKQTGVVQDQLAGEDKETPTGSSPSHREENQETELSHPEMASTDISPSGTSEMNVVGGLNDPSSQAEPSTSQEKNATSIHSHSTNDTDSVGENWESLPADKDLTQKVNMGQTSNPSEEDTTEMGTASSQAETNPRVWPGINEVIRQSQGVLVLTRSTDENAIFIPKLKFEFTPDNSVDWTAIHQPPMDLNGGGQTIRNDPRVMKACTPRGPSFSKSVLKKSFTLPGHGPTSGGPSESPLYSSTAGNVTRNTMHPLYGIVDLSISFQGKFEEQEIPKDIPKLLLTEEDNDED